MTLFGVDDALGTRHVVYKTSHINQLVRYFDFYPSNQVSGPSKIHYSQGNQCLVLFLQIIRLVLNFLYKLENLQLLQITCLIKSCSCPLLIKRGNLAPGDGGDWIIECKNYHEYNLGGIEQGAKYICGLILGHDII